MQEFLKRVATLVWSERVKLLKYFIVGISAVAIDALVYAVLTRIVGLDYKIANIFSVAVGSCFVFLSNKFWSFNARGGAIRQARRFMALFIANYFFQQFALIALVEIAHIHDMIAKFGIIAVMTLWNFILYRVWVYAVE